MIIMHVGHLSKLGVFDFVGLISQRLSSVRVRKARSNLSLWCVQRLIVMNGPVFDRRNAKEKEKRKFPREMDLSPFPLTFARKRRTSD